MRIMSEGETASVQHNGFNSGTGSDEEAHTSLAEDGDDRDVLGPDPTVTGDDSECRVEEEHDSIHSKDCQEPSRKSDDLESLKVDANLTVVNDSLREVKGEMSHGAEVTEDMPCGPVTSWDGLVTTPTSSPRKAKSVAATDRVDGANVINDNEARDKATTDGAYHYYNLSSEYVNSSGVLDGAAECKTSQDTVECIITDDITNNPTATNDINNYDVSTQNANTDVDNVGINSEDTNSGDAKDSTTNYNNYISGNETTNANFDDAGNHIDDANDADRSDDVASSPSSSSAGSGRAPRTQPHITRPPIVDYGQPDDIQDFADDEEEFNFIDASEMWSEPTALAAENQNTRDQDDRSASSTSIAHVDMMSPALEQGQIPAGEEQSVDAMARTNEGTNRPMHELAVSGPVEDTVARHGARRNGSENSALLDLGHLGMVANTSLSAPQLDGCDLDKREVVLQKGMALAEGASTQCTQQNETKSNENPEHNETRALQMEDDWSASEDELFSEEELTNSEEFRQNDSADEGDENIFQVDNAIGSDEEADIDNCVKEMEVAKTVNEDVVVSDQVQGGQETEHHVSCDEICSSYDNSSTPVKEEKDVEASASAAKDFEGIETQECLKPVMSQRERTEQDADDLLDKIISGKPDKSLGPNHFGDDDYNWGAEMENNSSSTKEEPTTCSTLNTSQRTTEVSVDPYSPSVEPGKERERDDIIPKEQPVNVSPNENIEGNVQGNNMLAFKYATDTEGISPSVHPVSRPDPGENKMGCITNSGGCFHGDDADNRTLGSPLSGLMYTKLNEVTAEIVPGGRDPIDTRWKIALGCAEVEHMSQERRLEDTEPCNNQKLVSPACDVFRTYTPIIQSGDQNELQEKIGCTDLQGQRSELQLSIESTDAGGNVSERNDPVLRKLMEKTSKISKSASQTTENTDTIMEGNSPSASVCRQNDVKRFEVEGEMDTREVNEANPVVPVDVEESCGPSFKDVGIMVGLQEKASKLVGTSASDIFSDHIRETGCGTLESYFITHTTRVSGPSCSTLSTSGQTTENQVKETMVNYNCRKWGKNIFEDVMAEGDKCTLTEKARVDTSLEHDLVRTGSLNSDSICCDGQKEAENFQRRDEVGETNRSLSLLISETAPSQNCETEAGIESIQEYECMYPDTTECNEDTGSIEHRRQSSDTQGSLNVCQEVCATEKKPTKVCEEIAETETVVSPGLIEKGRTKSRGNSNTKFCSKGGHTPVGYPVVESSGRLSVARSESGSTKGKTHIKKNHETASFPRGNNSKSFLHPHDVTQRSSKSKSNLGNATGTPYIPKPPPLELKGGFPSREANLIKEEKGKEKSTRERDRQRRTSDKMTARKSTWSKSCQSPALCDGGNSPSTVETLVESGAKLKSYSGTPLLRDKCSRKYEVTPENYTSPDPAPSKAGSFLSSISSSASEHDNGPLQETAFVPSGQACVQDSCNRLYPARRSSPNVSDAEDGPSVGTNQIEDSARRPQHRDLSCSETQDIRGSKKTRRGNRKGTGQDLGENSNATTVSISRHPTVLHRRQGKPTVRTSSHGSRLDSQSIEGLLSASASSLASDTQKRQQGAGTLPKRSQAWQVNGVALPIGDGPQKKMSGAATTCQRQRPQQGRSSPVSRLRGTQPVKSQMKREQIEPMKLYIPKKPKALKFLNLDEFNRYQADKKMCETIEKIKSSKPYVDCHIEPRLVDKQWRVQRRQKAQMTEHSSMIVENLKFLGTLRFQKSTYDRKEQLKDYKKNYISLVKKPHKSRDGWQATRPAEELAIRARSREGTRVEPCPTLVQKRENSLGNILQGVRRR